MSRPVAEFYSTFGVNVRTRDLKKVDRYLSLVERRLNRFQQKAVKGLSLNFNRFNFNRNALRTSLTTALERASKSVVFEVSRFAVNDRNLRRALVRSVRRVGSAANQTGAHGTGQVRDRYAGRAAYGALGERIVTQRDLSQVLRRGSVSGSQYYREPRPYGPRYSSGIMGDGRNLLYAGGGAGLIARQGIGAVPLIGGAYGLSRLNRAHQEIFVAPLTTQAVVQAQGYDEQAGIDTFGWLKGQAREIGFSYMDAAPDFNQILSNALGAGLNIEGTQDIFKGFNEYQTAMGITPYRRKLINNAMSQMLG